VVLKGPEGLTPYLQVPNNTPPREEAPVKYPERPRTDTRLQWYGKQTVTAIALTEVTSVCLSHSVGRRVRALMPAAITNGILQPTTASGTTDSAVRSTSMFARSSDGLYPIGMSG